MTRAPMSARFWRTPGHYLRAVTFMRKSAFERGYFGSAGVDPEFDDIPEREFILCEELEGLLQGSAVFQAVQPVSTVPTRETKTPTQSVQWNHPFLNGDD